MCCQVAVLLSCFSRAHMILMEIPESLEVVAAQQVCSLRLSLLQLQLMGFVVLYNRFLFMPNWHTSAVACCIVLLWQYTYVSIFMSYCLKVVHAMLHLGFVVGAMLLSGSNMSQATEYAWLAFHSIQCALQPGDSLARCLLSCWMSCWTSVPIPVCYWKLSGLQNPTNPVCLAVSQGVTFAAVSHRRTL